MSNNYILVYIFIHRFDSIRNSKLKVSVNGALKGAIDSPVLCNALVSVYVDKNTVSPSLKSNIGKTVFSWL